ncbi:MAG: DUF86 domain-containing protein [Nanoarchaeota archaeon]|nr:DUF86 domain-containing protein [Nanoarchaeota archaeon]
MRKENMYLKDILESISNIMEFVKGFSKEDFMGDKKTQSAVVRELEIIGEAVKNISEETREKYPEIEWRNIAGARDVFIHGYFKVDNERVWDVVENYLKGLREKIEKIDL